MTDSVTAEPMDPVRTDAVASLIWDFDNVELTTVGIDIGSATSHVVFSRVLLTRTASAASNSFAVTEREVLYESPVQLTPYAEDGTIAAGALRDFVGECYRQAGLDVGAVDAGAVILTGTALERANARAVADIFADDGGKLVCASAGHNLEAMLAAHGSGAVALSAERGETVLNIDAGGGTTKFSLVAAGRLLATLAIPGGGRLLAWDRERRLTRVEPSLAGFVGSGSLPVLGEVITPERIEQLAAGIADDIAAAANGALDDIDVLAGYLPAAPRPQRIVLSGGVASYLRGDHAGSDASHGDLGSSLAEALRSRLNAHSVPVDVAAEPMRATVIGASQFTVELSGNTVHTSGDHRLPLRNRPVVPIRLAPDLPPAADAVRRQLDRSVDLLDLAEYTNPVVIAVDWQGEPTYANLRAIADGVVEAHRRSPRADTSLVVCLDSDVAASIGRIIADELGLDTGVVVVDGIQVRELDFLDIGRRIMPANVVPVVVKSLLFPVPAQPRLTDSSFGPN